VYRITAEINNTSNKNTTNTKCVLDISGDSLPSDFLASFGESCEKNWAIYWLVKPIHIGRAYFIIISYVRHTQTLDSKRPLQIDSRNC